MNSSRNAFVKPDRNPLPWLEEEIREVNETPCSDEWCDVIGCFVKFPVLWELYEPSTDFILFVSLNFPLIMSVRDGYTAWADKQLSRGREPASLRSLLWAEARLVDRLTSY